MILADTSVWIHHLRAGGRSLSEILAENLVLMHPFVVGELACGHLNSRKRILADLNALPQAVSATHEEVFQVIEEYELWRRGIGWVDAHLLTSALLSRCRFWTLDRQLASAAIHARVETFS